MDAIASLRAGAEDPKPSESIDDSDTRQPESDLEHLPEGSFGGLDPLAANLRIGARERRDRLAASRGEIDRFNGLVQSSIGGIREMEDRGESAGNSLPVLVERPKRRITRTDEPPSVEAHDRRNQGDFPGLEATEFGVLDQIGTMAVIAAEPDPHADRVQVGRVAQQIPWSGAHVMDLVELVEE